MSNNEDQGSPREAAIPDVWALVGEHNPYLHNIFTLIGIDPEMSQADYDDEYRRALARVEADSDWRKFDRQITMTDVSRVDQLARSVSEFAVERLLAHTLHKLNPQEFAATLKTVEGLSLERAEELFPLPVCDLSTIAARLPELSNFVLSSSKPVSAAELAPLFYPVLKDEFILDL